MRQEVDPEQALQDLLQAALSGADVQCHEAAGALLESSKSATARQRLLHSAAAADVMNVLRTLAHQSATQLGQSSALQSCLLWLLQLTRNLSAGNEPFCKALLHAGALQTVLSLWDALLSRDTGDERTVRVVSQLVFNAAASSPKCLACIWTSCFPCTLLKAARLGIGGVSGPVCVLLLTACKHSAKMARSLFSHQGAQIITSLLNQVAQCEEASTVEDTLGILLHQFAYKQGFLPSLLACMANEPAQAAANGGSEARKCSQRGMCVEQSTALQILTDELEAANEDRSLKETQSGVWQSLRFLLYWTHNNNTKKGQFPSDCQVLEASLQALRAATSQDQPMSATSQECSSFCTAAVVTALSLLAALEAIQPARRRHAPHPTAPNQPTNQSAHHLQATSSESNSKAREAAASIRLPMEDLPEQRQAATPQAECSQPAHQNPASARKAPHEDMQSATALSSREQALQTSGSATALDTAAELQALSSAAISSPNGCRAASDTERVSRTESDTTQLPAEDLSSAIKHSNSSCVEATTAVSASPYAEQLTLPTHTPHNTQQPSAPAQSDAINVAVDHFLQRQVADSPTQLAELARQYPVQSPYQGYRVDLVALLANLSYRNNAVQQKVQQLGGVELILSQCQWDEDNPLVREYGLWAVRNLCEGNEAIQESISSLRACSTVDSPELNAKGLQIQLDGVTGKPKLVGHHKR